MIQFLKRFVAHSAVILTLMLLAAPATLAAQSPLACDISPLPDDNIVTSSSGRYVMVQTLYNDFNTAYTGGNIKSITVWDLTTCHHIADDIQGAEFFGWSPNEQYLAFGKSGRGPCMGGYCSVTYIFTGDLTTGLFGSDPSQKFGVQGLYPLGWEGDDTLIIETSGVSTGDLPAAISQQGFYKYDPVTGKSEYLGPDLPAKTTHDMPSDVTVQTSVNGLYHIAIINAPDATTITTWSDGTPRYDHEFHTAGKSTEFLMWSEDSRFAVMLSNDSSSSKILVFDAVVGDWLPFPQLCEGNAIKTCTEGHPLSISPVSDILLTASGWLINLNSLHHTQIPIANKLEKTSWSPDATYLLTEWAPSQSNAYCSQFAIWDVKNIQLRYFHVSSSCGEHISPDYVISEWRGTQRLDLNTFSPSWIQMQLAVYFLSEKGLYLIDPATGKTTKAPDTKG